MGDRLKILAYEEFKREHEAFFSGLLAFVGTRWSGLPVSGKAVNASRSATYNAMKRRLNPLLLRDDFNGRSTLAVPQFACATIPVMNTVARLVPSGLDRRIGDSRRAVIEAACAGRFEQSNALTAALTGLPLADYGYALPVDHPEQTSPPMEHAPDLARSEAHSPATRR